MNHQMIVVKFQPLWMLLLRGSTRVCSGACSVWVGDLWYELCRLRRCFSYRPCPGSGGASPTVSAHGEHHAERHKADESTAYWHVLVLTSGQHKLQQHQNTRRERTLPSGRSPVKLPPGSLEPCRSVKSKVTINSAGIARKHCAMDSFQPR